jgi:hypothetical protein
LGCAPTPGSDIATATVVSPAASRGSHFSFWASFANPNRYRVSVVALPDGGDPEIAADGDEDFAQRRLLLRLNVGAAEGARHAESHQSSIAQRAPDIGRQLMQRRQIGTRAYLLRRECRHSRAEIQRRHRITPWRRKIIAPAQPMPRRSSRALYGARTGAQFAEPATTGHVVR